MNISKLSALWALCTGGWSGLAVYLLEEVNAWLRNLDGVNLARFAEVVGTIGKALRLLGDCFLPAKYRPAASATCKVLDEFALALADGQITQSEIDANAEAIEAAVIEWKAV